MNEARPTLHPRLLRATLALAALHGLLLAAAFRFNNVDDAYISFRYGLNLMQGHGLVFNPGERVEGYTSFLWTMLFAPLTVVPIDIVWWSIAGGVLSGFAALWALARLIQRQVVAGGSAWLYAALPLVALDGSFAFWTVGGMETALFTALVLWGVVRCDGPRDRPLPLAAGLLLGLATWTRPEGALLFGLAVLLELRRDAAHRWTSIRNLALGWGMLVLPHLAWRRFYYDAWLPNTFHNKVSDDPAALRKGLEYVWKLFAWRAGVPLLGFLVLARGARGRRPSLMAAFTLTYAIYVIAIGGDWPVANRFWVPILPFLHLYAIRGLVAFVQRPRLRAAAVAAVMLAIALSTTGTAELRRMVYRNDNAGVETQRKRCGRWLRANLPAGTRIAVGPAGAIPYYSRLPAIDMWGLTDPHIARVPRTGFAPGHDRIDLQYVLQREPSLIIGAVGFKRHELPRGYFPASERIPAADRPREIVLARPGVLP